jgi:hypothetical protein
MHTHYTSLVLYLRLESSGQDTAPCRIVRSCSNRRRKSLGIPVCKERRGLSSSSSQTDPCKARRPPNAAIFCESVRRTAAAKGLFLVRLEPVHRCVYVSTRTIITNSSQVCAAHSNGFKAFVLAQDELAISCNLYWLVSPLRHAFALWGELCRAVEPVGGRHVFNSGGLVFVARICVMFKHRNRSSQRRSRALHHNTSSHGMQIREVLATW